ncbi:MAG TPA: hypothetical protein PLE78_13895 [Flavobacteriales bacterium]|nr:hypothetical protein [Flavobacteriales bacterium]HQW42218.1 hypothetical protein [Flavobacteriales bacterium]
MENATTKAETKLNEERERVEEAIVKVYMLQRENLRGLAYRTQELAPELGIPFNWVIPMDVPVIDRVVGREKPYLYYDRHADRFTHIVHAFNVFANAKDPKNPFPVQRVITIPPECG